MVNIELLIDVFEGDAVHFAVINSVVSGCVDFLSAFDFSRDSIPMKHTLAVSLSTLI